MKTGARFTCLTIAAVSGLCCAESGRPASFSDGAIDTGSSLDSASDGPSGGNEKGDGFSGADDLSSAACLDLSGAWVIVEHCRNDAVGDSVQISQTGCSTTDSLGFVGMIAADGSFTSTANALGTDPTTCTGTASAQTITQVCRGLMVPCPVTLMRDSVDE